MKAGIQKAFKVPYIQKSIGTYIRLEITARQVETVAKTEVTFQPDVQRPLILLDWYQIRYRLQQPNQ